MNPRKMLALMGGPRSPGLTRLMHQQLGGSTVQHPLSPVDVAHALAYVRNPLAVRVYQAAWCPGFDTSAAMPRLQQELGRLLLAELCRRTAPGYHDRRPGQGRWPACPPQWRDDPLAGLVAIARVVLFEIAHPSDCESCQGFGVIASFDAEQQKLHKQRCDACLGQGFIRYSRKRRASMLRIRYATFLKHLHEPYLWLLRECRRLEQEAADAHYRALDTQDPLDGFVDFEANANASIARR